MENVTKSTNKSFLYVLSQKTTLYMTVGFILLFFIADFVVHSCYGTFLSCMVVIVPNLCCALVKMIFFLFFGRKNFFSSFWNELKGLIIALSLYIPFLFVSTIAFIDFPRILSYILFLQFNFAVYFCHKAIKEREAFRLLNALLALLSFLCSVFYRIRGVTSYILFGAYGVAIVGAIIWIHDKLNVNLFEILCCLLIIIVIQQISNFFSMFAINGIVYTDRDLSGILGLGLLWTIENIYYLLTLKEKKNMVLQKKKEVFKNVLSNLTLPYIFLWCMGFLIARGYLLFRVPNFVNLYNVLQVCFIVLVNLILFLKRKGGKRNEQKV